MLTIFASSCTELAESGLLESEGTETDDQKVSKGLKAALEVGTDTAVTRLNKKDGYFKDELVKLYLPDDVQNILNKLKSVKFLGQNVGAVAWDNFLEDTYLDLIESLNRAAEDAAKDAKPIFVNAITGMSISDATSILFSDSTNAATTYLKGKTFTSLTDAFAPKMDASLDKPLIGGKSTNQIYKTFVNNYNTAVDYVKSVSPSTSFESLENETIGEYATQKALDGLFLKVQDEEKQIRLDPLARVSEILVDIFGRLDTKNNTIAAN